MASALFLVSWAVMMGPMVYGTSPPHPASLVLSLPSPPVDPRRSWLLFGIHTDLCPLSSAPPDLGRAPPVHSDVLWQYRLDAVLRARGEYSPSFSSSSRSIAPPPLSPIQPVLHRELPHLPPLPRHLNNDTPPITAPKHLPHPHILDRANGSTGLVPRLVLSHGLDGTAVCCQFWHESGDGLDEWMRNPRQKWRVCCCGVDVYKSSADVHNRSHYDAIPYTSLVDQCIHWLSVSDRRAR